MRLIPKDTARRGMSRALAPAWLLEVLRLRRENIPWPQMLYAVLAICVPLGAGLAAGRTVYGVLPAIGGLLSVVAGPRGPFRYGSCG